MGKRHDEDARRSATGELSGWVVGDVVCAAGSRCWTFEIPMDDTKNNFSCRLGEGDRLWFSMAAFFPVGDRVSLQGGIYIMVIMTVLAAGWWGVSEADASPQSTTLIDQPN